MVPDPTLGPRGCAARSQGFPAQPRTTGGIRVSRGRCPSAQARVWAPQVQTPRAGVVGRLRAGNPVPIPGAGCRPKARPIPLPSRRPQAAPDSARARNRLRRPARRPPASAPPQLRPRPRRPTAPGPAPRPLGPRPRARACAVAAGAVGSPARTAGSTGRRQPSHPQRGPGPRPPPGLGPPGQAWRRQPSPGPVPGSAVARRARAARPPARS